MPARAAPERGAVGERELLRVAARVLRDGDDRGRAVALGVEAAHDVPGPLRRDHDHVVPFRRRDAAVVDVEAVREEQRRARLEVRRHLVLVERGLRTVGNEERHELRAAHGVGDGADRQARLLRRGRRGAAGTQPDLDLDARVVQVERMRVPLAAVPEHGDLAVQKPDVPTLEDLGHVVPFRLGRRG